MTVRALRNLVFLSVFSILSSISSVSLADTNRCTALTEGGARGGDDVKVVRAVKQTKTPVMNAALLRRALMSTTSLATSVMEPPIPPRPESGVSISLVDEMLHRPQTAMEVRMGDAVRTAGRRVVTLSQNMVLSHDNMYTNMISPGVIQDQQQSGRCWIFAGLNVIESSEAAKLRLLPNVSFSRTYLHFFNMLERSNKYLDWVIAKRKNSRRIYDSTIRATLNPQISDGGYYQDFIFLVSKYGIVPETSMKETYNSLNSDAVLEQLNEYLQTKSLELWNLSESMTGTEGPYARAMEARRNGRKNSGVELKPLSEEQLAQLQNAKNDILRGVFKILETNLGRPPTEFSMKVLNLTQPAAGAEANVEIEQRSFTPLAFARDFIKFNPDDYVMVSNLVNRPRNESFSVRYPDIHMDVKMINLTPERMRQMVEQMVDKNMPVWFAADMGPGVDNNTGIMHPELKDMTGVYPYSNSEAPANLTVSQEDYLGRIQGNHAMSFIGYDKPKGVDHTIKFAVENSWSEAAGTGGLYHMYPQWFDKYVEHIIVPRSMLTQEELAIWDGKVHKLSPNADYH